MTTCMSIFGLSGHDPWMDESRRSYRPPRWPPPRDWVVSEDRDGNVISRWGDSVWNLSPWAGHSFSITFNDDENTLRKNNKLIDKQNADLLRLIATWRIWGIRSCSNASSFHITFCLFKQIITLCSESEIVASDLSRHSNVLDKIPEIIRPTNHSKLMVELLRLLDASTHLGFILVNNEGLRRLAIREGCRQHYQTAYIPPRIWTYIVLRFHECVEDYLKNINSIEGCFRYCLEVYTGNSAKFSYEKRQPNFTPFHRRMKSGAVSSNGCKFYGTFIETAERFNISSLIKKWVEIPKTGMSVLHLTYFLSLVQTACAGYVASFTLQRIDEVSSLRYNCIQWEYDKELGRILTIIGPTTKTEADSDARWITSHNVEKAIIALRSICQLRMLCNSTANEAERLNPYLFTPTRIPWSTKNSNQYATRLKVQAAAVALRRYKKLFDFKELTITSEDMEMASKVTPDIAQNPKFSIGSSWPFSWHQLRRTGAVNMLSSGLISNSTLQFLMKHASRLMPLYYGRGYTALLLNDATSTLILKTMYESMASRIQSAVGDRFVSPHGQTTKQIVLLNLIGGRDLKELTKAAEQGRVFFRETLAGGCAHRGTCTYGGIESISQCTGSNETSPCPDALFDRNKESQISERLIKTRSEAGKFPSDHPRHKFLTKEIAGLEYILNVLRT